MPNTQIYDAYQMLLTGKEISRTSMMDKGVNPVVTIGELVRVYGCVIEKLITYKKYADHPQEWVIHDGSRRIGHRVLMYRLLSPAKYIVENTHAKATKSRMKDTNAPARLSKEWNNHHDREKYTEIWAAGRQKAIRNMKSAARYKWSK
jgi:hypothetical protein